MLRIVVAVGDVSGDGNIDIVIVDAPTITAESKGKDGLFILLGDGKGDFSALKGSPFATGKSPSRLAIGDVDGNGKVDSGANRARADDLTSK